MAHYNGQYFVCNLGELSWVLKWPSQINGYLGAILVNQVAGDTAAGFARGRMRTMAELTRGGGSKASGGTSNRCSIS